MSSTPAEEHDPPLANLVPQGGAGAIGIRSSVVTVGQGPGNDVRLDDDTVSTHHARLEYSAGAWRLVDLGSTNGTYVDGVRLDPGTPLELTAGALLAFGASKLSFTPREGATPAEGPLRATIPEAPGRQRPAGFRLPVWVLLVILIVLALAAAVLLDLGRPGTPAPTDPPPATALSGVTRGWSHS